VTITPADGKARTFVLDGGFAQMEGERLTLLSERAMEGTGIDAAAAARELAEANAKVTAANESPLSLEQRSALERAQRLARAKIAAAELAKK
jgi:F0F1-type ATP synthase epsilon subunit